jgi:hypothetical protein
MKSGIGTFPNVFWKFVLASFGLLAGFEKHLARRWWNFRHR